MLCSCALVKVHSELIPVPGVLWVVCTASLVQFRSFVMNKTFTSKIRLCGNSPVMGRFFRFTVHIGKNHVFKKRLKRLSEACSGYTQKKKEPRTKKAQLSPKASEIHRHPTHLLSIQKSERSLAPRPVNLFHILIHYTYALHLHYIVLGHFPRHGHPKHF